jgi:membrane-bound lytic murein transglycosylase MltF
MNLLESQQRVKGKIESICQTVGIDPAWAVAMAMTESSLGIQQKSPTGCRGVFQMSSIAMKDLLLEMDKADDEWIDILCGIAFLHLLLRRHGTIEDATSHFCDPNDRDFYVARVKEYMGVFA